MYLLQLAQFFGHLVGTLLLLALFSHRAVTSLLACATTGAVRSPEPLPQRSRALSYSAPPRPSRAIFETPALAATRQNHAEYRSHEADEGRDDRADKAEDRLL